VGGREGVCVGGLAAEIGTNAWLEGALEGAFRRRHGGGFGGGVGWGRVEEGIAGIRRVAGNASA